MQKIAFGAVALAILTLMVSIPSAYADPAYCSGLANNDKLSSGGELAYRVLCTDFEVEDGTFGSLENLSPETIVAIGPNTKINGEPPGFSFTSNTQSEVSIDSCGNSVVAGWNDSQQFGATGSFNGYAYSLDNGSTWTDGGPLPTVLGGFNIGDPSIKADSNCNFYYATLVLLPNLDSAIGVSKSVDGGVTFSPPVIVDSDPNDFLDKELIAVGPNPAGGQDIIHISFTSFTGGDCSVSCPIEYWRSLDGGATWQDQNIFNPNGASQGSYPVADPNSGDAYVFYQDFGNQTQKVFRNTNAGALASWQAGVDVDFWNFVNTVNNVCERRVWNGDHRVNEYPVAAVNPVNGHVYVAWNNAEGPGFTGDPNTDIVFYRSVNNGATWLGPFSPHPALPNNDQFIPAIDTAPDGEIKMIWYDRRDDPQNLAIDVFASSSTDGGQNWQPNVKVTTVPFTAPPIQNQPDPLVADCYFVGEYNGIDVPNTTFAHAAWGDGRILTIPGQFPAQSQPDVFYAKLEQFVPQKPRPPVGGEYLPIDVTALILVGVQSPSTWLVSVLLGAVAIGVVVFRKNPNNSRNIKAILQDYLDRF